MDEYNIKKALRQCKKAASKGYKMADEQYRSLEKTLHDAEEKIRYTQEKIKSSPCNTPETMDSLIKQLSDIEESMGYVSAKLKDDLVDKREDLSKFTISLFGRTMAGKSTLMEILTEGNGDSIGNGSQRTTRDIRKYGWNGLEITDVPGIGAFEGEEDENIALESARKADMVLFLLSDDAPQAIEGDFFSTVVALGKPIACVLNVKCSFKNDDKIESIRRKIEKVFNEERLATIREQFLNYAKRYGQDWEQIPFIFVHLKAAYVAEKVSSPAISEELIRLSNIDAVKKTIIDEVMLMYGKEASNRKQEIDRQHYTIPNQRPKDKHCGKI